MTSGTSNRHGGGRIAATFILSAAAYLFAVRPLMHSEQDRLNIRAGWAFAREDYSASVQAAEELLAIDAADPQGLLMKAASQTRLHQDDEAIRTYRMATDSDDPVIAREAWFGLGERLYKLGQLAECEQCLRSTLALDPQHLKANRQLAQVLYMEGRTWEALPFIHEQLRQGAFVADELVMAASTESWVLRNEDYRHQHSSDLLLELGAARIDILKNNLAEATKRIRLVLDGHQNLPEAHAVLGEALLKSGDAKGFEKWKQNLPEHAYQNPNTWWVLGSAAQQQNDEREAVRCFVEALKLHPFHSVATYQLSQVLFKLNQTELGNTFSTRAARITEIHSLAGELQLSADASMMQQISQLLLDTGRPLEAQAWADLARRFTPAADWHRDVFADTAGLQQLTDVAIPGLAEALEVSSVDHSGNTQHATDRMRTASPSDSSVVAFEEVTGRVGIHMQYDIGKESDSGMEHIFETTGCGVAAMDFDLDNRPDLYFAQAADWEHPESEITGPDKLYRNRGAGFEDVSVTAGIIETGFSQGVTYGDLNDDGFPDIYVCNLAANSCFMNNGDGTFQEVAISGSPQLATSWTTSAAIADLNRDGCADIYVVNYLDKQKVKDRACKHEGQVRACAPTMFPGSQDQLLLSNGDGTFRDVTEDSGIVQADGKGLGILVADFFGDDLPELYVGNDTAANFMLVQASPGTDNVPRFFNEALQRGLAYNDEGRVQATMGMATTDLNGDGLLDIFATNFYHDANILYIQTAASYFREETRNNSLFDAGFLMLGFGTQFIDSTLSGEQDIVITNGHVDRTFATGEPDVMRPQYFRNRGAGDFAEVADLNGYFQEEMLGRTLALLDWNNDGLQDFAVTHLDRPAALIENKSQTDNHFLKLTLVGREACRDPIGAKVELTLPNGKTVSRQWMTGDGYEVRNQNCLLIGLGTRSEIDRLNIRWPGRATPDTWENIQADQHYTAVEGRGLWVRGR